MTTLELHVELPASPEAVWEVVGPFGGLADWHPWVPNCTLSEDGAVRTIAMGAISAIEVLEEQTERSHTYRVQQSPMPVEDYRCTWTVTGEGGRARLGIRATFEPRGVPEEQAVAMLQGFFDAAFATLSKRFA